MKTAKELYPRHWKEEQETGSFYGPGDYQPIINEMGKVLVQVDDKDYQGDSRVILERDGKYGFLIFGWGSCSGCDALQACNNTNDIQEIIDDIVNDIKWFDSLKELQKYISEKDFKLEFYGRSDETTDFVNKVMKLK